MSVKVLLYDVLHGAFFFPILHVKLKRIGMLRNTLIVIVSSVTFNSVPPPEGSASLSPYLPRLRRKFEQNSCSKFREFGGIKLTSNLHSELWSQK